MSSDDKGGFPMVRLKLVVAFMLLWPFIMLAIVETVTAIAPYVIAMILLLLIYKVIMHKKVW